MHQALKIGGKMKYLSNRLNSILNCLLHNEEYVTSVQLSALANVSTRTIKKDIVELNEFLKEFEMEIMSKTGVGYSINIKNYLLYNQLLQDMKNSGVKKVEEIPKYRYERVNYIIKKMLTVDYYLTLEDLMEELYISRTTLTADMKEVREIFKDYNLDIITRPNYGILLVGDEMAKRLCIAEYFFHSNVSTGYFAADNAMFVSDTNQVEIDFISNTLSEINEKLNIKMADLSFQNFVIHILVAIRRWKFYGYIKQDSMCLQDFDKESKEFVAAKQLIEKIEHYFNILLPDTEICYFGLHFKSKHIAEIDELKREDIELGEKTFYQIYYTLQHNYNYIVKNKQLYEEYLRLHLPAMASRLNSGLVMRNPQINEILSKYLCSTHITVILCEIIEKNFDVRMNRNEFAYLVLYTNLLFDFNKKYKEKILLVCGRGRPETITLINEVNESSLQISNDIEICDVLSLETKKLSQYDYILSTVPLEKKINNSYYYLNNDISYVPEIEKIIRSDKISYNRVHDYFSEETFASGMKGTARDEIFQEISKKLNMPELVNLFWESEHIISHETLKNVVFLHVTKPVQGNFVFVGLMKKPIIWNKQWAQIVVFVNINDNLQKLFNCYLFLEDSLFRDYVSNSLSKISKFDDFEEQILKKEGI